MNEVLFKDIIKVYYLLKLFVNDFRRYTFIKEEEKLQRIENPTGSSYYLFKILSKILLLEVKLNKLDERKNNTRIQ